MAFACTVSFVYFFLLPTTMQNGTRLAAIDLGSNSFRLEIGKYEGGQIERVEYLKETVRQGAGLDDYYQGQAGGVESVALTQAEMPAHTHAVQASNQVADQTSPNGNVLAQAATGSLYGTSPTATMAPQAVSFAGKGQPHNNMMPYNTLNCIIALTGIFPARP